MQATKVLYLASEAEPLVKVGGLGDVAGSLPRAMQQLSPERTGGETVDVRLAIPFHAEIRRKVHNAEFLFEFEVPTMSEPIPAQVFQVEARGVRTFLIYGPPIGEDSPVYDPDAEVNGDKYIFFSLAALEMIRRLDWRPDILHANDWHTALAIYALKLKQLEDPSYEDIHSVLTIHNLPFMGAGTAAAFDHYGLPPSEHPLVPWWGVKFPLVLGLQTAERIVAVSPTYAREIMTPEHGYGLEALLKERAAFLAGILNGIDTESWNPAMDASIAANFDVSSLEKRRRNKAALIEEFSLDPDPKIPLLIMISRLDQQKGVDLAIDGLYQADNENWQAILLGTGDAKLEEACRHLEQELPGRVRAAIRFDAKLSRRMYAGGDILLMPSRYEPCGLAQMMAMRYGCVPLGRATGGLKDTIVDSEENGTGFLFGPATSTALVEALQRALAAFADPERWPAMQRRGMRQDFSWESSAVQHVKLYRELLREQAGK